MKEKNAGVQEFIKNEAPNSFYIHCSAHCLNLAMIDLSKFNKEIFQFFETVKSIRNFIMALTKRYSYLEAALIKKMTWSLLGTNILSEGNKINFKDVKDKLNGNIKTLSNEKSDQVFESHLKEASIDSKNVIDIEV